jgi:flagellar basal-body rod protein FlgC
MAEIPGGVPMIPRPIRTLLGPLGVSAAGMARDQKFLEVIANNIANAETTQTADGTPYRRQIAVAGYDKRTGGMTTTVHEDMTPGQLIHDPGSPDQDADGNVRYPNVDIATEMVDMMLVRRMHDANATAFESTKAMLRKALDI